LAACQPSDRQIEQELQSAITWTATGRAVLQQWLDDNVPLAYATHTLELSLAELDASAGAIRAEAGADAHVEPLLELLGRVHAGVARAKEAIQRGDRTRGREDLRSLDGLADELKTYSRTQERPS
jgi:hypothetical protein